MSSQQALAAFDAAVEVALEAAAQNAPDLVSKVAAADALFPAAETELGSDALREHIRKTVLPRLQQDPRLTGRLNYAASLAPVSGQSPFFHIARTLCAEQAEVMPLQYLPDIIESFRRKEKYPEMQSFADLFNRRVQGNELPVAYCWRAKVSYELHMAAYQQGEAATGDVAQEFYRKSRALAEQSAQQAERAIHPCGRLFALMNVSGLLLPKMGKWKEGLQLSRQVGAEAEALAEGEPDDEVRKHLLRIAMDACYHRLVIGVEHCVPVEDVRRWLEQIKENLVYQSCIDSRPDIAAVVEAARKYAASSGS